MLCEITLIVLFSLVLAIPFSDNNQFATVKFSLAGYRHGLSNDNT